MASIRKNGSANNTQENQIKYWHCWITAKWQDNEKTLGIWRSISDPYLVILSELYDSIKILEKVAVEMHYNLRRPILPVVLVM